MIDWTDRSEDVLARFEAYRQWQGVIRYDSQSIARWRHPDTLTQ